MFLKKHWKNLALLGFRWLTKSIEIIKLYERSFSRILVFLYSYVLYKICLFGSNKIVSKIKWLVRKFYISKFVKRNLAWSTYVMLDRPECQYFLLNLAAGYTKSICLCLIVGAGGWRGVGWGRGGSNCKFWKENLASSLNYYERMT